MDKAFLVAADENIADILFWWIYQCVKFHPDIPIQVVDLGLKPETRKRVERNCVILDIEKRKGKHPWFNKPRAMLASQADTTLWMDIDTEFVKNVYDVFDLTEDGKIGLVPDQFWVNKGKPQYNTGVILYQGQHSNILKVWDRAINSSNKRGDQDVLLDLLTEHPIWKQSVFDLPDKYNYVRLEYMVNASGADDLRVVHWTGPKGKEIIRGPKKMGLWKSDTGSQELDHGYDGDIEKFREQHKEKNRNERTTASTLFT